MCTLPDRLNEILGEQIYKRENSNLVQAALIRLGVETSGAFLEFYKNYAGPFWEEYVPFVLLDLIDEENNIESYTMLSRKEHSLPKQYLVLSEMSANTVIMLDTVTDEVYLVHFEGGDELLIKGELKESWSSFFDFLQAYFNC